MTVEQWNRETEHAQKALDARAGPFQLPDTARILAPINDLVQELEDVLWQVFDARFIDNASGRSLEILGAIVGEDPLGESAEDFRLRIRLKLRALRSTKRAVDFIELLSLLETSTFEIQERAGWVIVVQSGGTPLNANTMQRVLQVTSADGVLIRFESAPGSEDPFYWPSADGSISGAAWPSEDGLYQGADWPGVSS